MEQLQQNFTALKERFSEQEQIIKNKLNEQEKNSKLLEAFREEANELISRTKIKMENGETLTADEYVELKNADTGLKARIEYHEAVGNDLNNEIYLLKESLFILQQKMNVVRSEITEQIATQKLDKFISDNQTLLGELFSLLYYTGKFKPNEISFEEESDLIINHLKQKIGSAIPQNYNIEESLKTKSPLLLDFKLKTPTAKHREQFSQTENKGLNELLSAMVGN